MLDRIANWPRRRLLGAWAALQAALLFLFWCGVFVFITVDFKAPVFDDILNGLHQLRTAMGDLTFWAYYFGAAGIVTLLQAAILWPVRRPAPPWRPRDAGVAQVGRSMWVTVAAAGLCCALLWGGVVLSVADAIWLATGRDWEKLDEGWRLIVFPPILGWIAATPLLIRFVRGGPREDRLGRLCARLFLGTMIEALAIIPVDVMVRRKTDCYCGRGTFLTFVACGTVGLATFGPAILLPLLARRRKRWYASRCDVCLYDMSGTPNADRCPECGAGWR